MKKEGYLDKNIKIVDLPGIYAMDTYSNEEKVAKDFLKNGNVDLIINIVDASNLNRNLYLTMQLKEFNKPIVLVLNMIDSAKAKGIKIDYSKLSKQLGVTVIPIIASKGKGINELKALLKSSDFFNVPIENNYHFNNEKETYEYIDTILSNSITYTKKL